MVSIRGLFLIFIFFISAVTVSSVDAVIIDPALSAIVEKSNPNESVPVIIHLSDKVKVNDIKFTVQKEGRSGVIKSLREKAAKTQGPLRDFLKIKGARDIKSFWITNAVATKLPAGVIEELKSFPGIDKLTYDSFITLPPVTTGTTIIPAWNIERIKALELWNLGYKGAGIVVANMDTGVDFNHPDLQAKWRGGTNSWFDPYNEHPTPYDNNGHGTATMGVMVGGDNSGYAIGVAPDAKWVAVKIFNDAGQATYGTIHQSFQWILDPDNNPDTDDAPHIVNNSWGFNAPDQCITEFQDDISALKASNIFVVFSGGNYNTNPSSPSSISPANNSGVFSVGATDANDSIANFSSRGPSACDNSIFPTIVAPGINIYTTDLYSSYGTFSGTSFSAPHVAGAAALLLSALPGLSIEELEAGLINSASDLGATGPDNNYGYGIINVFKTLAQLLGVQTHTINATAGIGGSISPSGVLEVIGGMSYTFSIAPDPGYKILAVLVDGVNLGSIKNYTFSSISTNHTINASFALASKIYITPAQIDFGNVNLWRNLERVVTIKNNGLGNLVINRIQITGYDAPLFYTKGLSTPKTLLPGETVSMTVGFKSRPRGLKAATLKIYSNDPDTSILSVPLIATAKR